MQSPPVETFTAGPETFLSAKCAGTTSSGLDVASTSHIFALGRSAWTRTGHSSSWIIGTMIPATVSQSRACTAALRLDVLFPARHLSSAPCASAAGRQRSSLEAAKFCDKLVTPSPPLRPRSLRTASTASSSSGGSASSFQNAQSSPRKVCAGHLRRAP